MAEAAGLRVLQISHRHHVAGGSDAVFFATSRLLAEAGHDVVPFCMDDPANRPSEWSQWFPRGADTGRPRPRDTLRYFWNREAARRLSSLIAAAGPFDIAHLHIYHGKQTPSILHVLRRAGIPVVQTLHEYKLACPVYTLERAGRHCEACVGRSVLPAVVRRCKDGSLTRSAVMAAEFRTSRMLGDVRLIDRFLCVSDFQRRIMLRAGLPRGRVARLHNCVPVPATVPPPGDELLYFGRIERLKGVATLVAAAARTGQRLVIAGDGSWRADLLRAIADLPNVRWAGFLSGAELSRLVAGARAVVVPSEWAENCPMSVLEAKALGRPVIGARVGGIPELVRDGVDGLLFQAGDVEALATALARLDDLDLGALSRAAYEDAARRFSSAAHLGQLVGHYRAAIDAARGRRGGHGAVSIQMPSTQTVAGRSQ